ncbi:Hypothetical protein HDN1F_24080 [gamma proteobacterium HdN1]|nr:Hypothetical protein HDN1F_24080 [gamma proteobacterium HdN1]
MQCDAFVDVLCTSHRTYDARRILVMSEEAHENEDFEDDIDEILDELEDEIASRLDKKTQKRTGEYMRKIEEIMEKRRLKEDTDYYDSDDLDSDQDEGKE